jgi:hypothetical protein
MREHDPTTLAFAPPQSQQFEQLGREHGIAVPAALALFDADQHALAVNVVDLEMGDLRHPQARTIGDAQRGLVFDTRRRFEQAGCLLNAQNLAHCMRTPCWHQTARQIPPQSHRTGTAAPKPRH